MTMKIKHFKHWAESELGEGIALMETAGEDVIRQIEIYDSQLIWCTKTGQSDDRFMLADQPFSSLGLGPEHEITAAEFEDVWRKAKEATACQ